MTLGVIFLKNLVGSRDLWWVSYFICLLHDNRPDRSDSKGLKSPPTSCMSGVEQPTER